MGTFLRHSVVVSECKSADAYGVQENAFNPKRTTEAHNWNEGQYTDGLIEKAEIPNGSNIRDDQLCPNTVRSLCHARIGGRGDHPC